VWTETPTGGTPNFCTGAGGYLQTALQGYTGLRINDTALSLSPLLPEATSVVELLGVAYLGARIDARYDAATLRVTVQAAPAADEVDALAAAAPRAYAAARAWPRAGAAAAGGGDGGLAIAPSRQPLHARSQIGRVVLGDGFVVAPRSLQLVDAAGGVHALLPGATVALPRQRVAIIAAA
jgi:hypothetical protein